MNRRWIYLTVAVVLLFLAGLTFRSGTLLPYNMDEFYSFIKLGCADAPYSSQYNDYDQGCRDYELSLPGTRSPLPLRSYLYAGNFYYTYYPFFKFFQAPISIRVHGFFFFVLNLLLMAGVTGIGIGSVVLGAMILPIYFFAQMADTGPVGSCVTVLLLSLWALKRAFYASSRSSEIAWALVSGAAFAFGIFIKLNFLWYLPVYPLFVWYHLEPGEKLYVRHRLPVFSLVLFRKLRLWIAFGIAFILPVTLLMISKDSTGVPYYKTNAGYLNSKQFGEFLLSQGLKEKGGVTHWNKLTPPVLLHAAELRLDDYLTKMKEMSAFLWDGALISHRIVKLDRSLWDFAPIFLVLALSLYGIVALKQRKLTLLWLMAAAVFVIACIPEKTWAAHHIVLCMPFLVWAAAAVSEKLPKGMNAALALFVLMFWGSILTRLPHAEIQTRSTSDKDRLLERVWNDGMDQNRIEWNASWGTYFISSLFGAKDRLVISRTEVPDGSGITEEFVTSLVSRARNLERGILVLVDDPGKLDPYLSILGQPLKIIQVGKWHALSFLR